VKSERKIALPSSRGQKKSQARGERFEPEGGRGDDPAYAYVRKRELSTKLKILTGEKRKTKKGKGRTCALASKGYELEGGDA